VAADVAGAAGGAAAAVAVAATIGGNHSNIGAKHKH
jgi:hypothetical protein